MIKIILTTFFCFACIWTGYAVETVIAPINSPLWEKPDIKTAPLIVLTKDLVLKVEETKQVSFQNSSIYRNVTFYRIRLGDRDYWLTPGWQVIRGKVLEVNLNWGTYLFASGILLCIAGLSVLLYFRLKRGYAETDFQPMVSLLLIIPLILFHYAWFIYLKSIYPDTYLLPIDESEYFRIANCLRQWDFSKPFAYTIGYPLFCIPFLWLNGSDNFLEISKSISYFSVIVMTPISISLAFILIRKLCGSPWKAFIAMSLYLLLPKFLVAVEYPYEGMLFSPIGIWNSSYIFCTYQFCLTGFNSLSEWVSVNLFFAIMVAALYWKSSKTKYLTLGLLFGIAMIVRMNNLLFAPLLAYLFWLNDRESLSDWRYLAKATSIAVFAAGVIFACQLVVNYIQLGSFFKTPYDLRNDYEGGRIGLQYFANMSQYYFKLENLYLAVGLAGMFLIRKTVLRNALILWILPTLLFFFCFNFKSFPYRFFLPIFPGIWAALVCSNVWGGQTNTVKKWTMVGIMFFLSIPILPFSFPLSDLIHLFDYNWRGLINFSYNLRLLLALPIWLLGLFYFRKDRTLFLYILFFGIMIYEGSCWLMCAAMVGLVLHAGYEWGRDLLITMRKSND